jgi:PqqD family protein of HPr-rel-A system
MSAALYSSDKAEAYLVTPLDELTAIYHRASGMTHLVGDPMPQIMTALHEQSSTLADLLSVLAKDHGLVIDGDAAGALQSRLDELITTGLIARA